MAHLTCSSFSLLIIFTLSFLTISNAMYYQITNEDPDTPGGRNFTEIIGFDYAKEVMGVINDFIWNTVFEQYSLEDRKPVYNVDLFMKDFKDMHPDVAAEVWEINKINFNVNTFNGVPSDMLKKVFTALMYHEMTHVFQWNGQGLAPGGLTEGIADYTVIRANYIDVATYTKPGEGNQWDEGYGVTARFLEYCDTLTPSFVAKLNKMMRPTYDVSFFQELTGKSVEQLWDDYKTYYGQNI